MTTNFRQGQCGVGGLVLLLNLLVSGAQAAGEQIHWSYGGEHGPEHWGELSPDFVQCKVGVNQSPVDITAAIEADLEPLVVSYTTSTTDLVNNGHTAQASVAPGSFILVDGEKFELLQVHLHAPSEHRINGRAFLMESHYVHSNKRGELAVVGVLHQEAEYSPLFKQLEAALPKQLHQVVPFELQMHDLGPASGDTGYYRYNGSLTTPPCSEGVRWIVLKQPRPVTREQQEFFIGLIGEDARGPQPVNARVILK